MHLALEFVDAVEEDARLHDISKAGNRYKSESTSSSSTGLPGRELSGETLAREGALRGGIGLSGSGKGGSKRRRDARCLALYARSDSLSC